MTPLHSNVSTKLQQARLVSAPCCLYLILTISLISGVAAFPALERQPRKLHFLGPSNEHPFLTSNSVSCQAVRLRPVYKFPGRWISRKYPIESSDASAAALAVQKARNRELKVTSLVKKTKELANLSTGSAAVGWKAVRHQIHENWWSSPMILALVPVFSITLFGQLPSMPPFWRVGKMDAVFSSPYSTVIIGSFLLSNLAYLLSGTYLLLRFSSTAALYAKPPLNKKRRSRLIATRYTWLGAWNVAAGLISTLFHSVQALGPYRLAECMCYFDHAVALSAVFYFWHTCGPPSRTVWFWGLAGVAALAFPASSATYAYWHSAWHFFSAIAATIWALQGYQLRQSAKRARINLIANNAWTLAQSTTQGDLPTSSLL